MQVSRVFSTERIIVGLTSRNKRELFEELVHALENVDEEIDYDEVLASLWQREEMLNTRVAPGIAIPHTQVKHLERTTGILGISREGIDYGLGDGEKIRLVVMIIDDHGATLDHLDTLRNFAILARNQRFVDQILEASDAATARAIIVRYEEMLA